MKEYGLTFRKGDLLAVVAVVLAAVLTAVLLLPKLKANSGDFARIYRNGELIREVPLSVDQTFQIRGDYTNTVTVRDGKIAVTHSDCPTNDCVHMGWLSDGGAIVCLPNRVEIRLTAQSDVDIQIQ